MQLNTALSWSPLGLALLLGTGGVIIHYRTGAEEGEKKVCWLKGSPGINGIGKSAGVRDETWPR